MCFLSEMMYIVGHTVYAKRDEFNALGPIKLTKTWGGNGVKMMVLGAGAMGLLLAARLKKVYPYTQVVTRTEEQASTIRERGIGVEEKDGSFEVVKVRAIPVQHDIDDADVVFLTVKQTQLDALLPVFPHVSGLLVCMQNGLGHLERLSEAVGKQRIVPAVTAQGALRTGLRDVRHTGFGTTWIGSDNPDIRRCLKPFVRAMQVTRFPFQWDETMDTRIRKKWVINCVINPLTVYYRCANGALLQSVERLDRMWEVYREICRVHEKEGMGNLEELWEEILKVCRNTSTNHSSMLQDIEARRRTEIEAMNGVLIEKAERYRIDVPVNRGLYEHVKIQESKR